MPSVGYGGANGTRNNMTKLRSEASEAVALLVANLGRTKGEHEDL